MSDQPAEKPGSLPGRIQRDLFAWSLLASLLLFAALAAPYFARRVYTRDDLGALHLPVRAFYARQLARGEPFDWMPGLYSGVYLTGEGQGGTYHPLHLLLYRFLPLRAALGWEWLAAYPFMLAGSWLFLRRRLRRDAAMLGGLLFTFCSFNLLHFVHPNAVAVVAHIPWLLWTIDVGFLGSPRKAVWAQAGVALLTGSQLLLGYPQYVWFSLIAEVAYAGFVMAHRRGVPHAGRPAFRLVMAKGCGLLLGAVQLLPTMEALGHSARQSGGAMYAAWGSLPPLNLVQLVAPYLFTHRVVGENTHELGLYAGAVTFMLVVWLLIRRRKLGPLRPLALAAGGLGLLALWLAFGEYGRLYRLQHYLPLVGHFRFPCRYLVLFQLSATVLAAIGFVLLVGDYQHSRGSRAGAPLRHGELQWRIRSRRLYPLWMVVAASGLVALAGLALHHRPSIASVPAVLAGPLLIGTAAVLVALAANGVRAGLIGLILFAAIDLGCYGLSYGVYPQSMPLGQFVAAVAAPPAGEDGRVVADLIRFDEQKPHTGNAMTLLGWRRADGYLGLEPRRSLDYRCLPALRAAGARWVKRGETTARIEGLLPYDDRWMEVPGPLPRVRLVSRTTTSRDPARDIRRIDIGSTALTEVPLALPEAPPGRAELVAERPGRLHIRCDCPTPQLLVVSESYHPGWQARVDGKPQPVWRVNGDFMGCLVGPGRQRAAFEFRPRGLHHGRVVSCLGLTLVLVCFAGFHFQPTAQRREDEVR